jgi:hypothetical protein
MIETVKQQNNGWLVDGNKSVPNDERNSDCQAVLQWIADGGIVEDEFTQAELDQKAIDDNNATVQAELLAIDMASIRSLREYVASQTDAPQFIKDHNDTAIAKRGKLK